MKLFENFKKGNLSLINRVAMAPMTRARNKNGVYNSKNAEYYAQRAGEKGAGLIITEGTVISPSASGMVFVPGIYTPEMVEGAKLVTKAVHDKNSKIFVQTWHVGRVSHTSLQPDGKAPVGPSDIRAENSFAYCDTGEGETGFVEASKPRALSTEDAKQVIRDFAQGAKNAIEAGFDGVEIHGANGYLIEQFLNPKINNRTDEYGGSVAKRVQFLLDIVDANIAEVGADKVAVRLSPFGTIQDIPKFEETEETFKLIAEELGKRKIAYIHFMNQIIKGESSISKDFMKKFRSWYDGVLIYAGGLTKELAEELIDENIIDIAAFGQPFISNPDLTYRMKNNYPLTEPIRDYYYGGNEKGYTDYKDYQ
ncbi:alkene reductase [Chryseobacterium sp.]|uniref:alkene reductase n=1 Tax=Chryseobacterium sp. TaxID=1871047 RepID=UPI0025C2C3F2|nr:alkene reductase [Chryseobacterium sp.]